MKEVAIKESDERPKIEYQNKKGGFGNGYGS